MESNIEDCPFCTISAERVIAENDLAYAVRDGFPVSKFHTLIIPRRHAEGFFTLTEGELLACNRLLLEARQVIY